MTAGRNWQWTAGVSARSPLCCCDADRAGAGRAGRARCERGGGTAKGAESFEAKPKVSNNARPPAAHSTRFGCFPPQGVNLGA